jgi:epoxyqueuosine reductase
MRLSDMIEERGWKGRIVPVGRLADLKNAILGRFDQGLINERLYRDGLSFFSFDPPAELPDARSIIIVAVPTPQMRITFRWHGEAVPVIVPPTYVSYTQRTRMARADMALWLESEGYSAAKTALPLKTLAVCSGLAEYGRNNICFVSGMGSFLQLVGVFAELPADEDPWREPKALDRCGSCVACLRHCPTGAIDNDRFLVHAERCLTYHNEAAGDFPDWIAPSWHHCLVGCMRCQTACPENRPFLDWVEDRAEFFEEETALMIRRIPLDELPRETAAKLRSLEINEDHMSLCRNLSMLVGRESPA